MKNLQEAYAEVMASETLKAKFAGLQTREELFDLVRSLGVEAKDEEIIAFLQEKASAEGELNDEALLQVAGGKCTTMAETVFSVLSAGLGCAVMAGISAGTGRAGTELKQGMLCNRFPGSH